MAACVLLGAAVAAEPLEIEVKHKPGDRTWKIRETRTLAHAAGFVPRKEPAETGDFGGDPSRKLKATGFFHPVESGGRWILVDPEGHPFIHVGVCSLKPTTGSGKARKAFDRRFAGAGEWAGETVGFLREHGFNGSGSWSDDALIAASGKRLAYCPNWNFMSSYGKVRGGTYQKAGHTGYPGDAIFVFDPGFEAFAMEHAAKLAAKKDDPWLLGHFSDNELPVAEDSLDKFLKLPEGDPGGRAAREWLAARKKGKAGPVNADDRDDFIEYFMGRYFSIVSKAIKAHDPNHLYLGCRFHGQALRLPGAFRAAGKHCDVVSVNYYGAWTPDFERMASWVRWSGRPFMITEFYAKGEDSGMPNTSGAGWLVRTQRDRGLFYQNFCIALLESKGCVGWHYFKYQDNDPENRKVDPSNTDSNKGIMTASFEPYPDFLGLMREMNLNVHPLIGWIDRGGRVHPRDGGRGR